MLELKYQNPQVQLLTLKSYESYFVEALKSPDDDHAIFYKRDAIGISISFSWDNFIVQVDVPYSQIIELYKDQNMNVAEVTISQEDDHPFILKFMAEYLFNRGIPTK